MREGIVVKISVKTTTTQSYKVSVIIFLENQKPATTTILSTSSRVEREREEGREKLITAFEK